MDKKSIEGHLLDKFYRFLRMSLKKPEIFPTVPIVSSIGAGVGSGVLADILINEFKENKSDRVKNNIKMYQAIESPSAGEETEIDKNIYKNSAALDIPMYAAAASVPAYLTYSAIKDKKQEDTLKGERREIGGMRDAVNDAYREDLLNAYGISSEDQLKAIVKDLRIRAGEAGIDKKAFNIPLSTPAAIAGASALGLAGFLTGKNYADEDNPNRKQNKEYLNKLDRLYRERLVSPTIKELPFTDEELIAMELYKREKGRKAPAKTPEAIPVQTDTVDMDDADIQSIIKEL